MRPLLMRFLNDRSGASAIEYALIVAGVAMVMIAALQSVGVSIGEKFQPVQNALQQNPQ